jgi:hypothetical protein
MSYGDAGCLLPFADDREGILKSHPKKTRGTYTSSARGKRDRRAVTRATIANHAFHMLESFFFLLLISMHFTQEWLIHKIRAVIRKTEAV